MPPQLGLIGYYVVSEYMGLAPGGLCPGYLVHTVGVEEAAQGAVAIEAGALDTLFPTVTHAFLEAAMACSQAFKRYGAAKADKQRKEQGS